MERFPDETSFSCWTSSDCCECITEKESRRSGTTRNNNGERGRERRRRKRAEEEWRALLLLPLPLPLSLLLLLRLPVFVSQTQSASESSSSSLSSPPRCSPSEPELRCCRCCCVRCPRLPQPVPSARSLLFLLHPLVFFISSPSPWIRIVGFGLGPRGQGCWECTSITSAIKLKFSSVQFSSAAGASERLRAELERENGTLPLVNIDIAAIGLFLTPAICDRSSLIGWFLTARGAARR